MVCRIGVKSAVFGGIEMGRFGQNEIGILQRRE